jgi:hypothetical protein
MFNKVMKVVGLNSDRSLRPFSAVGKATVYRLDDRVGIRIPLGSTTSTFPYRRVRLSGPPSFLSNGYGGCFPGGWSGTGVKVTAHLQLAPRSRKLESLHLLPHMSLWHNAWLSTGANLSLPTGDIISEFSWSYWWKRRKISVTPSVPLERITCKYRMGLTDSPYLYSKMFFKLFISNQNYIIF